MLPIGTQKKTYSVFDTNLNQPEPFADAGPDSEGNLVGLASRHAPQR